MQLTSEQISFALLVLRVTLAVVFFAHGAQKVMGWYGGYGLAGTVGAFKNYMKIPAPLAYIASFVELFGGIFILAGFLTRLIALGLIINMVVAIYKVHWRSGFFLSSGEPNKGNGFEYNLSLIAISLFLFVSGAGQYSLDALLKIWV
jgi:putative oxidoreductase